MGALVGVAENPEIRRGIDLILQGLAALAREAPTMSADEYRRLVDELGRLRGRPLFLPYVSSGIGRGARVRLADGRWAIDLALGIGVHFFGHGDPDLVRTALEAAVEDTAMQGNLQMGMPYARLLERLLAQSGPRLRHGWIANSGAEANESALKIVRQKKAPASEVVVFRGAFHGRTTTMAELTDRPDYRRGQPSRETVHFLPFYSREDPDAARAMLRSVLAARPGTIAACVFELVQGEAGFRTAPREFFAGLMEDCRRAGIAVWVDEIQTFGRTGELFAFETLGLGDYVDVVTIGKMLQCAATLFTEEMKPDPALVSGTYAGSSVGLAVGRRIVERLRGEGYLGRGGRIERLGALARERLSRLARDLGPSRAGPIDGIGAMWALELPGADHAAVCRIVRSAFEAGLLLYYAGTGPYRLRLFLPAILAEEELDEAVAILRRTLAEA